MGSLLSVSWVVGYRLAGVIPGVMDGLSSGAAAAENKGELLMQLD